MRHYSQQHGAGAQRVQVVESRHCRLLRERGAARRGVARAGRRNSLAAQSGSLLCVCAGHAGRGQRRQHPGCARLPQQFWPARILRQVLAATRASVRRQGSPALRWLATNAARLGRGGRAFLGAVSFSSFLWHIRHIAGHAALRAISNILSRPALGRHAGPVPFWGRNWAGCSGCAVKSPDWKRTCCSGGRVANRAGRGYDGGGSWSCDDYART